MSIVTLTRKRIVIDTPIDPADVVSFVHIAAKVDNADRILSIPAPESFSDADRKARFAAATESGNEGRALMTEWWNDATKKYHTPRTARFDSSVPEFYEVVDENGKAWEGELAATPTEEGASLTYDLSGVIGKIVGDCDGTYCNCKN